MANLRFRTGFSARTISRRRLAGASAAIGTGVLAACGSKNSAKSQPTSSQASQPKPGGQLLLPTAFQDPSFDPTIGSSVTETGKILNWTNDPLVAFKAGPGVGYMELDVEPSIAERWEVPDAQTFIFHLRSGVTFANLPPVNGRALTPDDIKWTFEYLTRSGDLRNKGLQPSLKAGLFEGLSRIDSPDSTSVAMHLDAPFAPFLSYAASSFGSILPHEIFDQDGDFNKRIVGTGPWQVDSAASQKDSREVYRRNPTYFMPGRPYIEEIVRLVLPDNATSNAAFQTKRIDILDYTGLSYTTVQQVKASTPGVTIYDYLDPDLDQFYLNATKPPLDDLRVRKALALSVDRDELLRTLNDGKGEWAPAGSLPGLFSAEETRQMLKHDPAQARQLLSSAGYPNGVDIELIFPGAKYGNTGVAEVQLVQAQVKQGGINLALKSLDEATEGTRKHSNNFQLDYSNISLQQDLDDNLYGLFHPKSGHNYSKVNDPQLTPLLEAQRREMDAAKRRELWRQAVQRINDQVWAVAFLFFQRENLWWPYVKNYAPNWGSISEPLRNAWLAK